MQEIHDIFQIWGDSVTPMAADLGRPYDTVLAWKLRGRIPEDAWQDVIEAAAKRGSAITVVDILAVNKKLGKRGRKPAASIRRPATKRRTGAMTSSLRK